MALPPTHFWLFISPSCCKRPSSCCYSIAWCLVALVSLFQRQRAASVTSSDWHMESHPEPRGESLPPESPPSESLSLGAWWPLPPLVTLSKLSTFDPSLSPFFRACWISLLPPFHLFLLISHIFTDIYIYLARNHRIFLTFQLRCNTRLPLN